jgi:hypothetical protein
MVNEDGQSVTIHVPLKLRKHGGRKLVIAPEGAAWPPPRSRVDNTLVKALGRAFRWRKLLDNGTYTTIEEIAAAEKVNASYVSRVLRLTLLAPEIVAAILDGCQPAALHLGDLLKPFPAEWQAQRRHLLGFSGG